MYAFDTMNYSLRPNKIIQRQMAFDGLELLKRHLPLGNAVYIGFGSVWFADFILAHKRLGISEMISIERDPILAARARFNAPFRTVRVEEGDSTTILTELKDRAEDMLRPWIVWLDYTSSLTPEIMIDVDLLADYAPPGSVMLMTMNAKAENIGKGLEGRRDGLQRLLGDVVSEDVDLQTLTSKRMQRTLGEYISSYIEARCRTFARSGGFVPAFQMPYRDGVEMITVGGIFPTPETRDQTVALVSGLEWPGFPGTSIETPPLTPKEICALQTLLPDPAVVRRHVLGLGFDLEDDKLEVYCAHYRRYPSFFQVVG